MSIADFSPPALACLLAPFGLVFGSFANVLIHRLPQEDAEKRNVVSRPSHCPSCGQNIKWRHNMPIFSWLWLRGRCAACGWKIPIMYPVVELMTGALFAVSPLLFPFGTLIWFKGILCGYALIVLFCTDLTEYLLPDVLQFPLMILGLLFALPQVFWPETATVVSGGGWDHISANIFYNGLQSAPAWQRGYEAVTIVSSVLGLVLGYGCPWAFNFAYVKIRNSIATGLFHKEPLESGMGMGDFKMLAWLGAFWGWEQMLGILFVAVVIMSVFILPTHLLRRRASNTMYPLGCGLALAAPIVVFWGPVLWGTYTGMMQ